MSVWFIDPLPDDKSYSLTKLKAFADDIFSVAQMLQFFLYRIKNIVGNGENAVTSIFSVSNNLFKRHFLWVVRSWFRVKHFSVNRLLSTALFMFRKLLALSNAVFVFYVYRFGMKGIMIQII